MTLWHPDTCDCQIEIDDKTGLTTKQVKTCQRHAATGLRHSDVLAENQKKNAVMNEISASIPEAVTAWSFDTDNTLKVVCTSDKRADIEAIAAKFQGIAVESNG